MKEYMIEKFDRLRKLYGDETLTTLDIIETLIEEKLKVPKPEKKMSAHSIPTNVHPTPAAAKKMSAHSNPTNVHPTPAAGKKMSAHSKLSDGEDSRYVTAAERRKAYRDKCSNCGIGYNLQYDHIVKFSHGGENTASNLQILCRACNQRKEIRESASGFFG